MPDHICSKTICIILSYSHGANDLRLFDLSYITYPGHFCYFRKIFVPTANVFKDKYEPYEKPFYFIFFI